MATVKKTIQTVICCLLAALMLSGCLFANEGIAPAEEKEPASVPVSSEPEPALPDSLPEPASQPESEAAPTSYTLVVPEGYTMPKIGMTLEELGVCTAQEFVDQAQSGAYSGYPLIAVQAYNENRCFTLEGYLFPATYEFAEGTSIDEIIKTMLNTTEKRLNTSGDVMDQISRSGYTVDEILTLASIIQKESYGDESMPLISSVLHNRLAIGQKIECDVTISYVENVIKPFITGDENRYNEYYNTYKCPALPAGAICNPGMAAIIAALNPAQTDYYYFLTDADNNFYYATTYEEHQANEVAAGLK